MTARIRRHNRRGSFLLRSDRIPAAQSWFAWAKKWKSAPLVNKSTPTLCSIVWLKARCFQPCRILTPLSGSKLVLRSQAAIQ